MKKLIVLIFLILFLIYPPTTFAETRVVTANESSSVSSRYPDEEGRVHWHYSSMFVSHLYKNLLFPSQGLYQNRALFKFSNLGLPQGATINNARLTIYVNETEEAITVPITLGRLLSIWHEDTLTWNTQPSSSVVSVLNIYSSSTNMVFDVTDLVRKWLNSTYTNYGLVLYSDLRGDQEYSIVFSAAYTPVDARKPKIDIDYSYQDTTAPLISNIRTSNLRSNSATITWTTDDASSSKVEYGRTVSYGNSADSPDRVTSHSVIINNLSPGTQYHFRVKSKNSSNLEGNSSDRTFTTAVALTNPSPSPSPITIRAIPLNLYSNNGQDQLPSPSPSPAEPSTSASPAPTPSPPRGNVFNNIEEGLEDRLQEFIEESENEATQESIQQTNPEAVASKMTSPVVKVAGFFAKYSIVWLLLLIILILISVTIFITLHLTRGGYHKIKHHINKRRADKEGKEYSVVNHQIHPPASKRTHIVFIILSIILSIAIIIASYFWGVSQRPETDKSKSKADSDITQTPPPTNIPVLSPKLATNSSSESVLGRDQVVGIITDAFKNKTYDSLEPLFTDQVSVSKFATGFSEIRDKKGAVSFISTLDTKAKWPWNFDQESSEVRKAKREIEVDFAILGIATNNYKVIFNLDSSNKISSISIASF